MVGTAGPGHLEVRAHDQRAHVLRRVVAVAEIACDATQRHLDGALGDNALPRDLGVAEALRDETHRLHLRVGEVGLGRPRLRLVRTQRRAADRSAQGVDVADRVLAHVLGALGQLVELRAEQSRIRIRRQQHDADLRPRAAQHVGDHDAVWPLALREVEVGDEHVERGLGSRRNRALGIAVRADDLHRFVRQGRGQRESQQVFVFE